MPANTPSPADPAAPASPHAAGYRAGFWLAIGAAFGFSFKAIFVKLAYLVPGPAPVDAVTLLALRMAFAAPAFGVAALHTRSGTSLSPKQWLALAVVGLAGYYGASILDFWGLQYITAGLERLILFTYPTLTVLMGVLFFGKALHRRELFAILLTYAGVATAFAHDLRFAADAGTVWVGAGLVFASSLSYAIYLSAGGQFILRLGSTRFTALAMAVATGGTLLHYLLARPWDDVLHQSWPIYALALAMAVISTVLPVFMQSAAIKAMGAGPASLVGMVGPLATIFFGWLLLGETISGWQIFGAALVIAGVFLVGRR
ncbi:MAG: DMT family transporter [Rhodocyclaceae bacterium]|nr:DMT family transporter [Rhodocyclaceae bacterium]